jgi:ribosomal protein S18 acetylase RimI-like enzyme
MVGVMIREARPDELAAVGDLRVAAYEAGGFLNPGYEPELRTLGTQGDGTVLVAIPEDGPAAGSGGGPGQGPGDRPGQGPGDGPGQGPGNGPGQGPGNRPGQGPGDGPGRGAADPPGSGSGNGHGAGGPLGGSSPIAGTIMLVTWPRAGELVGGPDEAEIRALAVAPGIQHGGVGTGLLLTALNWAELAGARRVVLSTLPEMRAAHRLYERNGFRRLPDRDWSPRPGVQLLAYILELARAEDGG